jgi:hypothetical protein
VELLRAFADRRLQRRVLTPELREETPMIRRLHSGLLTSTLQVPRVVYVPVAAPTLPRLAAVQPVQVATLTLRRGARRWAGDVGYCGAME